MFISFLCVVPYHVSIGHGWINYGWWNLLEMSNNWTKDQITLNLKMALIQRGFVVHVLYNDSLILLNMLYMFHMPSNLNFTIISLYKGRAPFFFFFDKYKGRAHHSRTAYFFTITVEGYHLRLNSSLKIHMRWWYYFYSSIRVELHKKGEKITPAYLLPMVEQV